jgi:2Fe-2S ferredoxin
VAPAGVEFEAFDGETLMAAANRAGWFWPTTCGGAAICNRCWFTVPQDAATAFAPMEGLELEGLRRVRWRIRERPGERLGCQARVIGSAAVVQRGLRVPVDGDLLPFTEGSAGDVEGAGQGRALDR